MIFLWLFVQCKHELIYTKLSFLCMGLYHYLKLLCKFQLEDFVDIDQCWICVISAFALDNGYNLD